MTAISSKPPDSEKKREKEKKEKNVAPTKIVVRRLPPSMTEISGLLTLISTICTNLYTQI